MDIVYFRLVTATHVIGVVVDREQNIFFALFYPLHIALYVPITVVAAFKSVEWTPIKHDVVKSINDMNNKAK